MMMIILVMMGMMMMFDDHEDDCITLMKFYEYCRIFFFNPVFAGVMILMLIVMMMDIADLFFPIPPMFPLFLQVSELGLK